MADPRVQQARARAIEAAIWWLRRSRDSKSPSVAKEHASVLLPYIYGLEARADRVAELETALRKIKRRADSPNNDGQAKALRTISATAEDALASSGADTQEQQT